MWRLPAHERCWFHDLIYQIFSEPLIDLWLPDLCRVLFAEHHVAQLTIESLSNFRLLALVFDSYHF